MMLYALPSCRARSWSYKQNLPSKTFKKSHHVVNKNVGMRTPPPPNPTVLPSPFSSWRGQTSANLSAPLMGDGSFTETTARKGICHWFAVIIQIWLPAKENHSLQDSLWGFNKSDTIVMQSIISSAVSQETGLCGASAAAPHITLHFART